MCYATKRKIADCVKQLMRKKEIRKITIQDIMDATSMSRQSFYYHFKDIYDVLEWIERNDFADRIVCEENQTLEDWTLHLFHVLEEERPFFERVVKEIEWPKLLPIISAPIEEQMRSILIRYDRVGCSEADLNFCVRFVTNAYCYILMDYLYHKIHKTDDQLREEVHSFLAMMDTKPMFHSVNDGSKSRLVG
ncbi:MAG: TetR/AcrR family transcriptional regulator C-terminal domain-containing protein [bacterium]|nr:TetR/AcrR family transcriptional regulator C-terminal domain-containing protein [bacterium]MDY4099604.1 TetR/AcrR family transcriptional regulator C-terminal domain-containing protein [Lachnospiraceae bacterium]